VAERTLDLGHGLHPPVELLLERGFVAGAPKTGKTSTCVVLVEEADAHGVQSVALTPNDVWHGLRSDVTGEKPGLEHVIFGGSFADRPLRAGMGRGLARAAADGLRMVLVTATLSLDDRATLVADFLEELLVVNRTPLLLVVDEAHRFAPAGAGGSEPRKRCREAMINIAATGRMPAYIGLWVVTQRLAMLATDLRELANASIVHKLRGANDIKFARPWLENYLPDPRLIDRLSTLGRGEAFVVAPDAGDIAGVFQIRPRHTFDTSNSDDALTGTVRQPKGRSSVDLAALDATLGEALKEAEEHDPEHLRRRVAELQAELDRARTTGSADPAGAEGLRQRAHELQREVERARADARGAEQRAAQLEDDLNATRRSLDAARGDRQLLDELRHTLGRLLADVPVGEGAPAGSGAYPGDEHVLNLVRANIPAGGTTVAVTPVAKLRSDFLERTAQRLVGRVGALTTDEREVLLFLIGQGTFQTLNAIAKALSGSDSGSVRARWSKAVSALLGVGLVVQGGTGRTGRKENVDAWIRSELAPHGPSDAEISAVRDRALSVLGNGDTAR
jgi:hypothetical protein